MEGFTAKLVFHFHLLKKTIQIDLNQNEKIFLFPSYLFISLQFQKLLTRAEQVKYIFEALKLFFVIYTL
jgi:hypothetical protein